MSTKAEGTILNRAIDTIDKRLDLAVAIERLEPLDRAIVRYWLQGYTQREIGKMIGDPVEYTHQAVSYRLRGAFGLILDSFG